MPRHLIRPVPSRGSVVVATAAGVTLTVMAGVQKNIDPTLVQFKQDVSTVRHQAVTRISILH